MIRTVFGVVAFVMVLAAGTETNAQTGGSPNHILMTVQEAAISMNDVTVDDYVEILTAPTGVDFDTMNRTTFGDNTSVDVGSYRAVRLTISDMSWKATWGPSNPSPCDGSTTIADANGTIDLGGNTVFYFKTPDLGGNTLAFYRIHPPLSGYVGDRNHPFVLAAPVKVTKDAVTYIDLVMGVGNSLTCDQVTLFPRSASGDASTISVGQISGPSSGLSGAAGIYVDETNLEIGVVNGGTNRLTTYSRSDVSGSTGGNVPLLRSLSGRGTRMNEPAGAVVYTDPDDPTDDEVLIANRGNDSIGVFSRTATGNSSPKRSIVGPLTGLSRPKALALYLYTDPINPSHPRDPAKDELFVSNAGNDTVTIYNRNAQENSIPLYALSPFQITLANNKIRLTEQGGKGDVTAVIALGAYAGGTDLARAVGTALEEAATATTDFNVTYDSSSKKFTITVVKLTFGAVSVNLKWNDIASTARDLLGFLPVASGGLGTGASDVSDQPVDNNTGLSAPCGISYDPVNDEIAVANRGNHSVTFYDHVSSGNLPPKHIIKRADLDIDDLTGLNEPCGIYVKTDPVDPSQGEIFVTNLGNDTMTVYDRADLLDVLSYPDGNIPFLRRVTGLKAPVGLYYDESNDEIGVIHKGTSADMTFQPPIYPSSSNTDSTLASLSTLTGDYNVVLYGVDVRDVNGHGLTRPVLFSERGKASFDGFASPWPTFNLQLETQLRRQIVQANCPTEPNFTELRKGFYGIGRTGSFYAFSPGFDGSLQGAFVPDGSVFVGSLYDSSNQEFIIYGVRETGNFTPYLTSDGSHNGSQSNYAMANYWNVFSSIGPPSDLVQYLFGVGMGQMDNSDFIGKSGDANILTVINPTGRWDPPNAGDPIFRDDFTLLSSASAHPYSPHPGGFMEYASDGLSGAISRDGSGYIYASDADTQDDYGCPSQIGFGAGLRQRPAGSFNRSKIKGTYFMAALGDRVNPGASTTVHRSTSAIYTFDGLGHVNIAFIENAAGVISVDKQRYTYRVFGMPIPTTGDTLRVVDVVNIYIRQESGPYVSALIGMDGKTLLFYHNLNPLDTANPARLLGLAVFQSP
jgi:hypothetical protein